MFLWNSLYPTFGAPLLFCPTMVPVLYSFYGCFSCYVWLFPLAKRFDALTLFISFQNKIERLLECKIKTFQSNNGLEYVKFKNYLAFKYISQHFFCPPHTWTEWLSWAMPQKNSRNLGSPSYYRPPFHCRTRMMRFELLAISLMTFLPQLAPPKLLSKFYSIPLLITISYGFLEVSVIPSYSPTMMINYVLALSPMFFLVIVIPQRLQVPSLTH